MRILLTSLFLAAILPMSLLAHEFWIEPEAFQVESGAEVTAHLKNGQGFDGFTLPYATRSIVRLEQAAGGEVSAIEGRLGDRPAIRLPDAAEGLFVLGYESVASHLKYNDWAQFEAFTAHKSLGPATEMQAARGFSQDEITEGYTRFSKALVAVGTGKGADHEFGFETELLALANPYTNPQEFAVRWLYLGAPRPHEQIEIFARDPQGNVTVTTTRTDAAGEARIALAPGVTYMLDAVILRPPSDKLLQRMDVQWESLWANLTFAVPE
jgi:uncharacterized GH25 family protein